MRVEHWWYTLPLRIRSLVRRADAEHDLDDELADHVARLTELHRARGLAADAARTVALREIGGLEFRKEAMRDARRTTPVENLVRDIRYALRGFRRAPVFTLVAVITLAVGLGANTAIFTVVNAVLLRPLPYGDPGHLYLIQSREGETSTPGAALGWAAQSHSFSAIGPAQSRGLALTGRGVPEQLRSLGLAANLLPMLEVRPMLGRVFAPAEEHAGHDNVVVLSYDFWRRRFGADSSLVGKTLTLDGIPRTVIGVMPPGFQFAPFWSTHAEVFVPLVLDGMENDFDGASLRVFARLRPDVPLARAEAEMAAIGGQMKRDHPLAPADVIVVPLHDKVVGRVAGTLWMLLAAVGLVLLIACANVTHLQLVRAASRARETAMRLSLGATRGRLVQQALVECVLLSITGALLGFGVATGGVRLLIHLAPAGLPRLDSVRMDFRVFVFLLLVALFAGIASGVIPAIAATRVDPNAVLGDSARGSSTGRRARRTGELLVVSEFAMAVILLVCAGLVLRSVAAMLHVDTGFDPHHVLSMEIGVRGTRHDSLPMRRPFFASVVDRVGTLPGVESVSAINHLPLHGDNWRFSYSIEGRTVTRPEDQSHAYFRIVYPGYFGTMRVPLLAGRDISASDVLNRNRVVILDESAARADWPGGTPIGKRISVTAPGASPDWFTVIGLVKDVQQPDWSGPHSGEMYYPYWNASASDPDSGFVGQLSSPDMTLVLRTRGDPTGLRAAVAAEIGRLDGDAPVSDVITMDAAVAEQIAGPRFYLTLLGAFAGAALLLAAVGVYGVISHMVAARTRELGIRLALGASAGESFRFVVRHGLLLALLGTAAGLGGALLLTRYLSSLLFQVHATDPITFVAVPIVLVLVAAIACAVPAWRAASVEPVTVLRGE